ncbi:MAG: S-adenosylmethionine:tRNA ribosyltransferase-isomerase [Bacteroidota bacterium]|nr:S-adenosylmethionine:tRNA ribosyltransferase-isomerase [Bacteroidota bacterium]
MINRPESLKNIAISEFDYPLPDERIAKYPLAERDMSKLLVYRDGAISHTVFTDIENILSPGDELIFNNTRVIPARLKFQKSTGANIEIFCLEPVAPAEYQVSFQSHQCTWKCIVGNLKKWKDNDLIKEININGKKVLLKATKIADYQASQHIEFSWDDASFSFSEIIEKAGVTPIPPYLHRDSEAIDRDRYQTVYSKVKGSVAAPTAGLHFTDDILNKLNNKQVQTSEVTLHVGAGTFKPVQTDNITDHEMHTEFFSVPLQTLKLLVKKHGNIVAVGTTTLRTLESLYWLGIKVRTGRYEHDGVLHLNQWDAYHLEGTPSYSESIRYLIDYLEKRNETELFATTQIMIAPGYQIRSINALITNFHQPKSTLLLLVSAITGNDWKKIYDYALANGFRFLSYGDSSILFLPNKKR